LRSLPSGCGNVIHRKTDSLFFASQIGQKRAREMWFLARFYSAQEAISMGLINTVVPVKLLISSPQAKLDMWISFFFFSQLHPSFLDLSRYMCNLGVCSKSGALVCIMFGFRSNSITCPNIFEY